MKHHRHYKTRRWGATFQHVILILVAFIGMGWNHYYEGKVDLGYAVRAFHPSSKRIPNLKPMTTENFPVNDQNALKLNPSHVTASNTILLMAPGNSSKKKTKNDDNEDTNVSPVFWRDLDKKPGNLIILPFVALFGIDLLLNIIFITKRSIEYFVFGQAPSTETWWN